MDSEEIFMSGIAIGKRMMAPPLMIFIGPINDAIARRGVDITPTNIKKQQKRASELQEGRLNFRAISHALV